MNANNQLDEEVLTGAKLDATICERVMGWRRVEGSLMHGKSQTIFVDDQNNSHSIECDCVEDFNPSSNIADAMQVIEKMREKFPRVQITTHENLEAWYVEFDSRLGSDVPCGNAINESLPVAICIAALKAVDGEDKE